jgi:hypothetical protein
MKASLSKQEWENWKDLEMKKVSDILEKINISLNKEQIQLSGERFLMSGKKLVLEGFSVNLQKKVIVKYSTDKELIKEILDERNRKDTLEKIKFSYKSINFPKEIYFEKKPEYVLLVTEYIEQETLYVKMSEEDKFFLALKALEAFEGVHSVVGSHQKALNKLNKPFESNDYLKKFEEMYSETKNFLNHESKTVKTLEIAKELLNKNKDLIEKYCNFLTHDDFVPHNMRVKDNDVVVLDHSSLILGNKYESWARFLNFMLIYGLETEKRLSNFVLENRGEEEYFVLRLMRIFKISFLLNFYAKSILKSSDNLQKLQTKRLNWWTEVLEKIISNQNIEKGFVDEHHKFLEELRSEEEKKRHKEISG